MSEHRTIEQRSWRDWSIWIALSPDQLAGILIVGTLIAAAIWRAHG